MADFQNEGKFVAMVDAEFSFDAKFAKIQGLDVSPDKFKLFQPNCGEDAFTIVEKLAESGQVSCITVDSIAALVPTAEMNAEMTSQQMGAQARMIGKGLRKIAGICSKNKCTIIFINQLRMKIGCIGPDTLLDIE
jgi:recombination protein RecA